MKPIFRAGLIVLIGISASGCAMGGYAPGSLQRDLVAVGLSPTEAKCVVEGMTREFGEERLGGRAEPTADELKAERALLRRCGVKPKT